MKSAIFFVLLLACGLVRAQDASYLLAGKKIFIPKLSSREVLSAHPRLTGFIQTKFNRPGDFHGPNCYNTALITSGLYSQDRLRYVSPEEFEAVLKSNFNKVSSAQYQDLVVFDANHSRGHAAFYLGDELIFHKKSHATHYFYRITHLSQAGVVEENEWFPGPVDDSSEQMNWPELGRLPLSYYRLKSKTSPKFDPRLAALVTKIESLLLNDLRVWAIGKHWGLSGEYLLEALLKHARDLQTDSYTEGVIISLKDQLYTMIEEVYFKRARSSSRVTEQLCLPERTDQLFGLMREMGKVLKLDSLKVEEMLVNLQRQDLSKCRFRPFVTN